MSQLAISPSSYQRPSLAQVSVPGSSGLMRLETSLEGYARQPGWTLGVMLANVALFVLHAFSPTRSAGDERFWARG